MFTMDQKSYKESVDSSAFPKKASNNNEEHQYKGEGIIHDLVEKASELTSAPVKKAKKVLKKMYSSK